MFVTSSVLLSHTINHHSETLLRSIEGAVRWNNTMVCFAHILRGRKVWNSLFCTFDLYLCFKTQCFALAHPVAGRVSRTVNDKPTDWDGKVIFPFIFSCDVFQNSVVGVSPRVPGCTCVVSLCVPGRVPRSVSDSWVGDGHARSSIATSLSNPSLSSTSSPLKVSWQLYTEI